MNSSDPILQCYEIALIPLSEGVLLKRGCLEFTIEGVSANHVVGLLLELTQPPGIQLSSLKTHFPSIIWPAVKQLIDEFVSRRIFFFRTEYENFQPLENLSFDTSALSTFYWHFPQCLNPLLNQNTNFHISLIGINNISVKIAHQLVKSGLNSLHFVDDPELRCEDTKNDIDKGKLQLPKESVIATHSVKEWENILASVNKENLLVASSDIGSQYYLRKWNELSVRGNFLFLPVLLKDMIGYVGPLVVPGETACLECLRGRQNSHVNNPELFRASERQCQDTKISVSFHPCMVSMVADVASMEIIKLVHNIQNITVGNMIKINLLIPEMVRKPVLKLPRCPVCSDLNLFKHVSSLNDDIIPINNSDNSD